MSNRRIEYEVNSEQSSLYWSWKLWTGVLLMLIAATLSYQQLRGFTADEWASLTDQEQTRLLWMRSALGQISLVSLWVGAAALLSSC